ncbi:hypothetical protein L210DRAFT_3633081 [Boletus edulis BED1]|uniref:Methyltransferase domain-containing protein n=1 Tax=Boletus edulis BED1 TaxID=1328754 RepID=A0AAD4BLK1_BOLED|nr:hypothetical protein L210DRAFT_3633081 [Boletus edulis BED1]
MAKESLTKSFIRKPSMADLRVPFIPINNATDITQISPKRDGVIRTLLRKKKKSMTSSPPPDIDLFTIDIAHRIPVDDPVPKIQSTPPSLPATPPKPRDPSIEAFEELDRFVIRRGMRHHPYSRDDAPYMLAYNRILLDNDKFSEVLLRRLNQNHSPSFHDLSHVPPRTILDLGCGAGGWAVEAAEFWPSAQVIGFDLVDPARLHGGLNRLVTYNGNKAISHESTMANLSLCIPRERWEHVLLEARRVLAQGGRLELIDDYMYFPFTKRPPQLSAGSHGVRPSSSSFEDGDDDSIKEGGDAGQLNGDDVDDDDEDDDFVSTKSRFSSLVDVDDFPPQPAHDPIVEWSQNVDNSKSLEKLFEDMLLRKFSVHPWPSKFLDRIIDKVFGRYNQCRLHDFNLYLAPPPSQDLDDSSIGSSDTHGSLRKAGKDFKFAKWVTHEWDHHKQRAKGDRSSEESLPSFSTVPDIISAKAAGRLGIKHSPPPPSHSNPAQSPGLILWPTTFIPISPFELEMHACKHLHSLIGCKAALTEYLQDVAREQQLSFDEKMVDDLVWDYESFRRKRFNWPSECPDSHIEVPITTPRSNTFRNSYEGPLPSPLRTGSGGMSPPLTLCSRARHSTSSVPSGFIVPQS